MSASLERCVFAGAPALPRPCGGPVQRHHYLAQQRIKRQFPFGAWKGPVLPRGLQPLRRRNEAPPGSIVGPVEQVSQSALLADGRNLVLICWDHHQLVENERIYLEIPGPAWEFARELGLEGELERDVLRRTA